jgi:hypothetical protein
MKMLVKLAVLLSILLLGTGAAFAAACIGSGNFIVSDKCYEITATDLDNPALSASFPVRIILCNDMTGVVGTGSVAGDLRLWWFSPPGAFAFSKQMIVPVADDCAGYFKFHGENDNNVIGIGECQANSTIDRWTLKGHMTACP